MRINFPMAAVPLLITEIERLARDRDLSVAALCERLGVSPKTFYNLRAAETSLSLDLLARIVREFEPYPRIRDLALYFLSREYHEQGRPGSGRRTAGGGPHALPASVPYRDRWRISTWVAHAARGTTLRRGLYLAARDTTLLSHATDFVRRAVEQRNVTPVVLQANARLSASHAEAAIRAQVLMVERIEHASDDVRRVLKERGDALRTTVVTSCIERSGLADADLVPLFRSAMQAITLDARPGRAAATDNLTPTASMS